MDEPLMTDGADRRRDADLNVTLLIGNQVLERGLETLLRSVDRVSEVRIAKAENLQEALTPECDVLLVDTGRWSLLGTATEDLPAVSLPRILVIGDFPFERYTDKFTSLPSDGFLARPAYPPIRWTTCCSE